MFKCDLQQLLLEGCVVGQNTSIQNYIRCQSSNEADTESQNELTDVTFDLIPCQYD